VTWADALTMASREVRRRPARALLTVIAVTLAAALLTALLAIAGTAKTRVLSQLSHGGSLAGITVEPDAPNPSEQTLDDPVPGPPVPITSAALARISKLRQVAAVLPVVSAPVELLPPLAPPRGSTRQVTPTISTSVIGAPLQLSSSLPVTLLAGRFPRRGAMHEAVAGEQYLTSLGIKASRAAEVVGTSVQIASLVPGVTSYAAARIITVEIVGVVAEEMTAGSLVASPALVDALYASESGVSAPDHGGNPPVASAIVIARQLTDVPAVRATIATIGYSSAAPVGLIISVGRYLRVIELVLSGIGIVAVIIAGLGIANALFAAVRERRREIGVLKAIGARNRDVLRVFLLEAGALGLLGGVAGSFLGIAMAAAISADVNAYLSSQGLAGVALSVPWLVPAACVLGSGVVALLAGAVPAWRAAGLPAREAVDA
jgi:ABC-type antimicrobial peptide transport system permease subunit